MRNASRTVLPAVLVSLLVLTVSGSATAQTYTWVNLSGGSWGADANWNTPPTFESNVGLDFSTLNITAGVATTLDGPRTAGTLKFGDATTASNDWTVNAGTGGPLTLATTTGTPGIEVVNRTATINAVLAGTQGFEKTGAGVLVLGNNSSTFTGGVAVTAGTLNLGNLVNTQTFAFSGTALSVASGATLSMPGSSDATRTHTYNFGGLLGSTTDTNNANAIQVTSGTLAFSSNNTTTKQFNGRVHSTGGGVISYSSSSFTHNLNLNRAITGTGTLTFNWSGNATTRNVNIAALATTGTANNFTGEVILNSGPATTSFNLAQSLGATSYQIRNGWRLTNNVAGGLDSASAITLVNTGSRLNLGANPWTNASATLTANNGTIDLGTGATAIGTFVLDSDGTVTLNAGVGGSLALGTALDLRRGTLTGTGGLTGAAALSKTTAGTVTMDTGISLGGTTTISAGTLALGTNGSIAGPLISVGSSGVFNVSAVSGGWSLASNQTLAGSGTVQGNATIRGTHSPGNSPGVQTIAGNLAYDGGSSQVVWELVANTTSNAGGPFFDQIIVTGNVDFAAATALSLRFNDAGSAVSWADSFWDTNQSWTLYDVAGSTSNIGNVTLSTADWLDSTSTAFSTVRSGASFTVGQVGQDVVLTYVAVPEPTTLALVGIAAGILAAAASRRRGSCPMARP